MSDLARTTLHVVVPQIHFVADICRVERAVRALAGVRRVTLLEVRGGAARLSLRVDERCDLDAIARVIAVAPKTIVEERR